VPITPLLRESADHIVAVSVHGPEEALVATERQELAPVETPVHPFSVFVDRVTRRKPARSQEPGWLELLVKSLELMQSNLANAKIAAHRPDLLIEIPQNCSTAWEFYRADEIIELGYERANRAIAAWKVTLPTGGSVTVL